MCSTLSCSFDRLEHYGLVASSEFQEVGVRHLPEFEDSANPAIQTSCTCFHESTVHNPKRGGRAHFPGSIPSLPSSRLAMPLRISVSVEQKSGLGPSYISDVSEALTSASLATRGNKSVRPTIRMRCNGGHDRDCPPICPHQNHRSFQTFGR